MTVQRRFKLLKQGGETIGNVSIVGDLIVNGTVNFTSADLISLITPNLDVEAADDDAAAVLFHGQTYGVRFGFITGVGSVLGGVDETGVGSHEPLTIQGSVLNLAPVTGAVVTNASASGTAPLRIPHGTAPSSPVNGDIWTTTSGLFVRINGVTVGPLS